MVSIYRCYNEVVPCCIEPFNCVWRIMWWLQLLSPRSWVCTCVLILKYVIWAPSSNLILTKKDWSFLKWEFAVKIGKYLKNQCYCYMTKRGFFWELRLCFSKIRLQISMSNVVDTDWKIVYFQHLESRYVIYFMSDRHHQDLLHPPLGYQMVPALTCQRVIAGISLVSHVNSSTAYGACNLHLAARYMHNINDLSYMA